MIILLLLAELAAEVVLTIVIEFVFDLLILKPLRHAVRAREEANVGFVFFGLILLGVTCGFASLILFKPHLLPLPHPLLRGVSLVIVPLGVGLVMEQYGRWRVRRGEKPSYLATFWGGALFAFAMAAARFYAVSGR